MKLQNASFGTLWAFALVGMIWACSGSDFAGGNSKTSAAKKEDPKKSALKPDDKHNMLGVPINTDKDIPKDAGTGCKSADDSIAKVVGDKIEGKKAGQTTVTCSDRVVKVDVYDPAKGTPPGIDDAGDDANDDGGTSTISATSGEGTSTVSATSGASTGKSTAGTTGGTGSPGTTSGQGTTTSTATATPTGGPAGSTGVDDAGDSKTGKPTTGTGTGTTTGDNLGTDDGGTSADIWSDGTMTLMHDDDCGDDKVTFKIDSYLPSGAVGQTVNSFKCPKHEGDSIPLPKICYNQGPTCLKVTIYTKKTYDTWNAGELIDVQENTKDVNFVFDNGVAFIFGNPNADRGKDDEVVISCQNSKTKAMSIVNCVQ